MSLRQRIPREENEKHRRYISQLPCLLCGSTDVQCAHVRFADLTVGKEYTGKSEKPDDKYTLPICCGHHKHQHDFGDERAWWEMSGIDPVKTALALFAVSGDLSRGEVIISACREQRAA